MFVMTYVCIFDVILLVYDDIYAQSECSIDRSVQIHG